MKQTTSFGKYLCFPMTNHRIFKKDFQFIIDILNIRLQGWKTSFLNLAGMSTLIKATLEAIPNHVMQVYGLPKATTSKKLSRNFCGEALKIKKYTTLSTGTKSPALKERED